MQSLTEGRRISSRWLQPFSILIQAVCTSFAIKGTKVSHLLTFSVQLFMAVFLHWRSNAAARSGFSQVKLSLSKVDPCLQH